MNKIGLYEKYFKRILDILLSLIALIILMPFLIIVGIIVKIKLGSPILFKQQRPGLNEKIFTLYKFRTMSNNKNLDGKLASDERRLDKFGKFLRSTSIDELPALINIIKGDMSIVGPRPLLVEYLKYYDSEQRKRHLVRPGLSGYAQINGRNLLSWEEKFKLDIKYINNISFFNDVKIIFKTIIVVLKRKGVNSSKTITMKKFKGSNTKSEIKK